MSRRVPKLRVANITGVTKFVIVATFWQHGVRFLEAKINGVTEVATEVTFTCQFGPPGCGLPRPFPKTTLTNGFVSRAEKVGLECCRSCWMIMENTQLAEGRGSSKRI